MYKRQQIDLEIKELINQAPVIAHQMDLLMSVDGVGAVSYTHLDVYKRQSGSVSNHFTVTEQLRNQFHVWSFTTTRASAGELKQRSSDCLLYTSYLP